MTAAGDPASTQHPGKGDLQSAQPCDAHPATPVQCGGELIGQCDHGRIRGQLGPDLFDDEALLEPARATQRGQVNSRHAPGRNLAL